MKLKRLGQRGDTLVEVLVCIAIVSVILTGAYVTTNRSTTGVRDSQEHAEALKLVESQLEQVRSNARSTGEVFTQGPPFCMIDAQPVSASIAPDAAKCIQDSTGAATTGEPAYHLSITRSGDGTNGAVFTITAKWDSVTGHGSAQENMSYRLYK